jgi:hypothetical protein
MSERVQRLSNTQAGSEAFAKVSTLPLFSTGYKSGFDPFCLETIRSDRATITKSLQSGRPGES